MAAYDFKCPECGQSTTRYNVKIAERDVQQCDNELCAGALLQRSEDIGASTFQMDASGNIGAPVDRHGRVMKAQFGGGHFQKRRFKP